VNRFLAPEVPRRVVTGMQGGRAVVVEDGPAPNAHHYTHIPGMMTDNGVTAHLHGGDDVIQRGTRHAWRNRSESLATMCFILIVAVL
jgi:hypothetical protein